MDSPNLDDPDLMEKLDACVGYSVPAPFRAYLARLNEIARTTEPEANWWSELGFARIMTGGVFEMRYRRTPPEVFLFAAMGVDGVHYGHVNRAPELIQDDLPFVQVDPYQRRVSLEGATAADAFRELMIRGPGLLDEGDAAETARVHRVARQLGFGVAVDEREIENAEIESRLVGLGSDARLSALLDMTGEAGGDSTRADLGVPVSIPDGWRHVPTVDGIGVLAPAAAFGGAWAAGREGPEERSADPNALLAEARGLLRNPGAALVAYKDWFVVAGSKASPQGVREMAACYLDLGRPRLAAHALLSAGLEDDARRLLSGS